MTKEPGSASVPIDRALLDPNLLGAALGDGSSWSTWLAILRAAYGIKLGEAELRVFESVSGGRKVPGSKVRELSAVLGRRSGESRMAAAVAAYTAAFFDYRALLSAGEAGLVVVLAASRTQALTVFGYIRAFFESSPILKQLMVGQTNDEMRLKGNVAIAVHANSYRTIRGRTLLACIFDEVAFWRDETTSLPDIETYRAVLPALATTEGMLIGISSPYARRGLLFAKHRDHFGLPDENVLVVQAGTSLFNPTIDQAVIQQAGEDDPESAAAEWGGSFRGDVSSFIDPSIVRKCVESGLRERTFDLRHRYFAFCDPSGGAHDSMTLAIAHAEGERVVLDATREVQPPFSPPDVVSEFVRLLISYRISTVVGDRYASEWVASSFSGSGIRYSPSELSRSEIYLESLPHLMAEKFVLLDDDRLFGQICNLERRTSRIGRDTVDHLRGGADDLSNAALGALTLVSTARPASFAPRLPIKANLGYAHMKGRRRSQ